MLRIIYKPLDISFLNSKSVKFKNHIVNFEGISTEKIVIDFDILKNRINLNLGSIKLKKYNNNISNVSAGNVSAVIRISDLIKKSIIIEDLNISNGNIDLANITTNKSSTENFSNLIKDIPVNHINLKNINLNVYKGESRIAVLNNINGTIQKNPKNIIFDSFSINYVEYLDNINKNKLIVNNILVSNKYTDNYIIAIDSLDLINTERLIKINFFKKIKNISLKKIIANYSTGNKKISLEGNVLFKEKTSKFSLKGFYADKTITETLVKINFQNFPLFALVEEEITKGSKYHLQNVNNINFMGNIKLKINNNKLTNIDLELESIKKKSSYSAVLNIKNGNNVNIKKLILKANYKNKKIKIHELKVKSLEGNIYLKGNVIKLKKKLDYSLEIELRDFKYSNIKNITQVLLPKINQYKQYYSVIKDSYINNLVLTINSTEKNLKVNLVEAAFDKTYLVLKRNLELYIPEIHIKSNNNNIIINTKSSKFFNNDLFVNLSNTIIVLDKYTDIYNIKNNFEVTTNINAKYNSLYKIIFILGLDKIHKSYVKSIEGNIDGLLNIKINKSVETLSYEFSASLKNFNLVEENVNENNLIHFQDFQGELLVNKSISKITGKAYINESLANINILMDNNNKITAHITANAKASSFSFLKEYNYLISGTNKLSIVINKELNKKIWVANIQSDVFASNINLDFINYKKPLNTRGNLSATFLFSGNKLTKIKNLNFFTDQIIMKGSLYFSDNVILKKIEINEYVSKKNNFSALLTYSQNEGRTINIDGKSIDLGDFIDSDEKKYENLIFSLDINKLFYGDKYFGKTTLNAQIKKGSLHNINGEIFHNSKPYVIFRDIVYEEENFKKILLSFNDFGLFLREAKLSSSFIKGNGDISLIIDKENYKINSGNINISDSSVKNASFLTRLLQLASFTGLVEILTNEGIPFNKIVGDFFVQDKKVDINNFKFKGFSLGGTLKGNINFNNNNIHLEGVIVPAYAINSLINKIPIVGQIITGIEGEGLIGMNYKAKGTLDKPNYSINPLSILTPGIIRNIFDVFISDDSKDTTTQ